MIVTGVYDETVCGVATRRAGVTMPPEPGANKSKRAIRVGQYLVLSHIATGGMGAVYRAQDTEKDRVVALKILSPEMAAKPNMVERFRREARSAAKLVHPNVVQLLEFGEAQGAYFLAMEYVDGLDLQAYIREKGSLDWKLAKLILFQAAQALHHAHKQGIVHRDIKPSNFLVTRSDPPNVKLVDLGLAREVDEEEFRVTREGTTVGTVDYMSPEQARDSGSADIRSDIYSLGCTFYHMLIGHPPFAGGSLTERIFKHISELPPDLRELKPGIPNSLVKIAEKMLAKKPEDRFQTPKELLRALSTKAKSAPGIPAVSQPVIDTDLTPAPAPDVGDVDDPILTGNELLQGLLDEGEASTPSLPANEDEESKLPAPPARKGKRREEIVEKPRRDTAQDSEHGERDVTRIIPRKESSAKRPPWGLIGGGAAVAALALVGVVVLLASSKNTSPRSSDTVVENSTESRDGIPRPIPTTSTKPTDKQTDPPQPPPSKWKLVDSSAPKPDATALRKQFLDGMDRPTFAADAPVFRLTRLPAGSKDFDSLTSACLAADKEQATDIILEIHDNGPLWLTPAALADKNLLIRAAPGFRPLLVWDPAVKGDESALLKIHKGNLILENVELVSRCPALGTRSLAFIRVQTGSVWLSGCHFSVLGTIEKGTFSVVQVNGDAVSKEQPNRIHMHRCGTRGSGLTALSLATSDASFLVNESLLVGGETPLIDVTARQQGQVKGRIYRSTLVAQQKAIQVQCDPPELTLSTCEWAICDSVLARTGEALNEAMVHYAQDRRELLGRIQVHNSVYTGWGTLLRIGTRTIANGELSAWRKEWHIPYGDAAFGGAWPSKMAQEFCDVPAKEFRTNHAPGEPVGFAAATVAEATIGCPVEALPPQRSLWRSLAFEPYLSPPVDLLGGSAPDIPMPGDGRYHGERIDLALVDLGAYLATKLETMQSGPTIVLHLFTSKPNKTLPCSPIALKGVNLVVYFEPQAKDGGGTEKLVLNAETKKPIKRACLFDIEQGNLDLIGGVIQYPNYTLALVPPSMIRVNGGQLRIHDCHLLGPTTAPTKSYRGLIHFEGKDAALDALPLCVIGESVLVTAHTPLTLTGSGGRVRCVNSVFVASGSVLDVQPVSPTTGESHLHVMLENCTLAGKQAVLNLHDNSRANPTAIPVVVQSRNNAYIQPFGDKGGLLRLEGPTLTRGLLVWQSDKEVYDHRLHFAFQQEDTVAVKPQPATEWTRLWGLGVRQPVNDRVFTRTFTAEKGPFEALVVPPPKGSMVINQRPEYGADLWQLGLVKK